MIASLVRLIKPLALGIAFVALFGAAHTVAKADPTTYVSTGSFPGAGGANSITFASAGGTLTISFIGVAATVNATPPGTFASLGQFVTTVTGTGAMITPGTTFMLNITQIAPTGGAGSMTATLGGTIMQDSSMQGLVTFPFNAAFTTINGTQYSLSPNLPIALVPPATNNGVTTVQARIIAAVPEPTTVLLLGSGLAGVVGFLRRRKNKNPE